MKAPFVHAPVAAPVRYFGSEAPKAAEGKETLPRSDRVDLGIHFGIDFAGPERYAEAELGTTAPLSTSKFLISAGK